MKILNINQDNFIYPDFGIFYSKTLGSETIYISNSHRLFNIARVNETLYTSTSNIEYDGQYYFMSLDFDIKLFKQLLKEINDEVLRERIKKELTGNFHSPVNVDFKDKPIELMIESMLGKLETNQNEDYIPFIASSFSFIKVLNENAEIESLIPKRISHLMVSKDNPIGFAVKHGKQDKNEPNIINAYVCYPGMSDYCEQGSVYTFSNLTEAKNSFAWKFMGDFNYAVPIDKLNNEQFMIAEKLWVDYEDDFRSGFRRRNLNL